MKKKLLIYRNLCLADAEFSCVFNLSKCCFLKFCLENPNESKNENVEHFKLLLGFKISTIYRTRFEKLEKVERKSGSGAKCAFSSPKVRTLPLRHKQWVAA
jgi:hypothetical protein